ncbi:hypothetical protein AeMF1_017667 [Aphanomyces euteiches]|nr:hypothetical protein AeMF1_017667 [Aphanomyces euteiches]KAH9195984.1 hypothetical protein AeNC1_002064 [Aphanomyces euteiches]
MILRVPVADDFFKCAPLTPDQVEHFRLYGYESAHDLVEYTQLTDGRIEWVLHTKLTASSGRSTQITKQKKMAYQSTLDDMIAIFLTTNTQDAREANAAFFPDVPDIFRLYNITLPTPEKPHFCQAINWCLLSSPLRGFILKHRDWCYMEHQEECLINGKRAWIRVLKHVEVDACPSLEENYNIIRGYHLHAGHMYIESDRPGFLKVIELVHCRAGGSLSGALGEFMTAKTLEIRYSAMNATQKQVNAFKLRKLVFLPVQALVPKSSRSKVPCASRISAHLLLVHAVVGVERFAVLPMQRASHFD